ncbi:hypothetical protein ACX0G7_01955 [Flavitalea antarctica]
MVDNQLELLISLCEEEKNRLQRLIDECLAETEYLMAHYHSKALYQLNRRLHTLHNIYDTLYDKKDFTQRRIAGIQKRIEAEWSDYVKEYLERKLQREKEELENLNQITGRTRLAGNESFLDNILKKLVDKKIKNLKLILKKTDNFFLGFSYSNNVLKVTLPNVKQHTKRWILHDDKMTSFKNLGFNLSENETKLVLTLTGDKEDILNRLQIILLKIVFEIFYFKEFADESYIQFTDKTIR